jgi:hypothetical protein
MVLVNSSPVSLLRDHGLHPNLGVLDGPRNIYASRIGEVGYQTWAADNDAYLAWDETKFRKMLRAITGLIGCAFVSAPDVVGDSTATIARFHEWKDEIRETGQPIALVGQDGLQTQDVPWQEIQAFFVGGTTEWKLGSEAASLVREANERGLWTHMGRVNTRRRIRYAQSIGCDSVDGTNFSMYRKTNLWWALEMCRGGRQMALSSEGTPSA